MRYGREAERYMACLLGRLMRSPILGPRERPNPWRAVACEAFSLVEIVIALAVLGTMASGCYIGFNAVNAYAVSSRLYSEAVTAAQNHTDLILSKEPFDIMVAYASGSFDPTLNKVPVELMTTAELDVV